MNIKRVAVGSLQTNCYIIEEDNETIVIDPGGEPEKILKYIKGEVKYIINTHYHFDHTLANKEIKEATKAKILISEKEKDYIDFKPDGFLKENEEIKIGKTILKVLETPGHSKGSICLISNGIIFAGDTIFEGGYCGRMDLPGGSEEDMQDSLNKLKKIIKSETKIYPGHGEPFIY